MSDVGRFQKQLDETMPPPASSLGKIAQAWRESVLREFQFEGHHFSVLDVAAEALDRRLQARAILEKEGLVVVDAKGKPMPHPCVSIERDSALRFLRAVRELNLDTTPEESRPPGIRQFSGRRR